jgi:hypothetical protein
MNKSCCICQHRYVEQVLCQDRIDVDIEQRCKIKGTLYEDEGKDCKDFKWNGDPL